MEITGKVTLVGQTSTGVSKSGNGWQKKEFVIETEGQFPKKVAFSLFNDKANIPVAVGQEVTVSFDLSSREYNGRWYTEALAWKVEEKVSAPTVTAPAPSPSPAPLPNDADPLPF